jgi:Spy/CpxP family protein refolding chaperone
MNAALKWKLALGFGLVFIAGLATGAFINATHLRRLRPDFAHHGSLAERMRHRMEARLDLTPEQMAKAAPILDQATRELEEIRQETGQRVHEILAEVDRELAPALTAEQRARLEAMEKRWWKPRSHDPPPRRGERPPG